MQDKMFINYTCCLTPFGSLMNACQEQIPHTAVRTVSSYNCLEEEGKGLRKAEDTVLYILLTINHLQDINAMEFLTSSLKPEINCCGRGSKRQIQIIRYDTMQYNRFVVP